MVVDYDKLASKIPFRVHLGRGIYYEIVWVDDFPDGKTCGETRFEKKQIAIKAGMSTKLTVITLIHEYLHAFSDVYGLGLTENQILKMEKSFYYVLKPNNLFKS